MRTTYYSDSDSAMIDIQPDSVKVANEGPLNGDIVAGIDSAGKLVYLDVHGGASASYGLPDEVAVARIVAWAEAELAARTRN